MFDELCHTLKDVFIPYGGIHFPKDMPIIKSEEYEKHLKDVMIKAKVNSWHEFMDFMCGLIEERYKHEFINRLTERTYLNYSFLYTTHTSPKFRKVTFHICYKPNEDWPKEPGIAQIELIENLESRTIEIVVTDVSILFANIKSTRVYQGSTEYSTHAKWKVSMDIAMEETVQAIIKLTLHQFIANALETIMNDNFMFEDID